MSNSDLASVVVLSPHWRVRTHAIDTITIHHTAMPNVTALAIGNVFKAESRKASSNYGIGYDGTIGVYVPEEKRAITSSNSENDNRAITIEVSNNGGAPDWPVSSASMTALILLCTDICKRNGIPKLLWQGDRNLIGQIDKQNMTVHRWFASTACPGDYLYNKMGYIAAAVNERLGTDKEANIMEKRYDTISDLPDWAQPTIKKLCKMGIIDGKTSDKDEYGYPARLDLTEDMVRLLVIHDRIGLYDRK